jgi:hypothetical protein
MMRILSSGSAQMQLSCDAVLRPTSAWHGATPKYLFSIWSRSQPTLAIGLRVATAAADFKVRFCPNISRTPLVEFCATPRSILVRGISELSNFSHHPLGPYRWPGSGWGDLSDTGGLEIHRHIAASEDVLMAEIAGGSCSFDGVE